ncbi:MAG: nucleotidyl transferase AbiEii/AbiGii toxin family protein [Pseudomonadota bacterium]
MFQELLKKLAHALDSITIPYMLIGGQAVLLYGEPRLTKDIDITLGVGLDLQNEVMEMVNSLNLKILVSNPEDFVKKTMVLPALQESTGIRVDLIFSFSPYEKQAIERAKTVMFDDVPVKFASLEDVIIHKIIAGRPRDLEDIKTILLKNTSFDEGYIKKWLKEFDNSLHENFVKVFHDILNETKT